MIHDRRDGHVRAVRQGPAAGSTEVLSLDQIMRGNKVKVDLRAAAGPGESAMSPDRKEALAKDSLVVVNGVRYK